MANDSEIVGEWVVTLCSVPMFGDLLGFFMFEKRNQEWLHFRILHSIEVQFSYSLHQNGKRAAYIYTPLHCTIYSLL